jgi:hypothetical protein
VKEVQPKDLSRAAIIKKTADIININNLVWFDITNSDQALNIHNGEIEKSSNENPS